MNFSYTNVHICAYPNDCCMRILCLSLILCFLAVFCLCCGCTLPGAENQDIIFPTMTATPTQVPPDVSVVNPEPTATTETISISPQVQEIVTFTPGPTATSLPPADNGANETRYYPLMDDTQTYTSTSRTFDLNVTSVPFLLYFSFDPGYVKKTYVSKDSTTTSSSTYEVFNTQTGKYERYTEHGSTDRVLSTTRIDPDAWFTIDVVRIYDDPVEYQAALAAEGGKEKLASQKRLYEDNGIVVMQDGYAHGFSSEVEKELKLLRTGHYRLLVSGNSIDTNILILSPE